MNGAGATAGPPPALFDDRVAMLRVHSINAKTNFATSSIILKWKMQFGCAVVWWAMAIVGCFGTESQSSIAFLVALFIGIFFHFIFGLLGSGLPGTSGELINYLSMTTHFDGISRGLVDSRDLVYFGSIIFLGLVMAEVSLAKRNISE